jgi:hypothetical protein
MDKQRTQKIRNVPKSIEKGEVSLIRSFQKKQHIPYRHDVFFLDKV